MGKIKVTPTNGKANVITSIEAQVPKYRGSKKRSIRVNAYEVKNGVTTNNVLSTLNIDQEGSPIYFNPVKDYILNDGDAMLLGILNSNIPTLKLEFLTNTATASIIGKNLYHPDFNIPKSSVRIYYSKDNSIYSEEIPNIKVGFVVRETIGETKEYKMTFTFSITSSTLQKLEKYYIIVTCPEANKTYKYTIINKGLN